jgi:crossover junction endodeoxyribonuclease RuvC
MFVWGFDPGLSRCGYGALDVSGSTRAVAAGVIRTDPKQPTPARLAQLQDEVVALLQERPPAVVAVERVLFSANARTAIPVAQAAGVIMAEAFRVGAAVVEYSPNEVKLAVCGDGSADKAQVEAMVRRLLRVPGPLRPVDAADALAIALTHVAGSRFRTRVSSARVASNA